MTYDVAMWRQDGPLTAAEASAEYENRFEQAERRYEADVRAPAGPKLVELLRRMRTKFTFTPEGSSWINQIETWFGIITRQSIRRGTFSSVRVLIKRIQDYITSWNKEAESWDTSVRRLRSRLSTRARLWRTRRSRPPGRAFSASFRIGLSITVREVQAG